MLVPCLSGCSHQKIYHEQHNPWFSVRSYRAPATALGKGTPLAAWCECRPVVRAAAEAAERRAMGETVDAASWRAMGQVLSGLLPACRAAGELGEREQKKLEAAIARAVVSTQEVVIGMLHEYRESTRKRQGRPNRRSWTSGGARSGAGGRYEPG